MPDYDEPIIIPVTVGQPEFTSYPDWWYWEKDMFKELALAIATHDRTMQNQIYGFIYNNLNKVQDNLKASIDAAALQSFQANQSLNKMLEMLGGTTGTTMGDISSALDWLKNNTLNQSNEMNISFNNMNNSINDSTNKISSKIDTLTISLMSTLTNELSDVSNKINKNITDSNKSVENSISLLDLSIQDRVADSENTIKYSLGNVQNNINTAMSLNTEKVTDELKSLSTMIDAQKGTFKEGFEWFWEQLRGWLESNVTVSQQDLLTQLQNQISTQVSVSKQLHS